MVIIKKIVVGVMWFFIIYFGILLFGTLVSSVIAASVASSGVSGYNQDFDVIQGAGERFSRDYGSWVAAFAATVSLLGIFLGFLPGAKHTQGGSRYTQQKK